MPPSRSPRRTSGGSKRSSAPANGTPDAAAEARDHRGPGDLAAYEAMRDFGRTPEPAPASRPAPPVPEVRALTFVVQKHRATRLHYDLRLEFDGVMKSWPIPRGPSPDPAEKRLAVMTEDHPLDYARFEGLIPAGQYGAGEVIVWDNGTYSPDEGGVLSFDDPAEAERRMLEDVAAGKISVTLRGKKLKGSWTLVKTQQDEQSWLAIKHRDDAASAGTDLTHLDRSVISGLTIEDLQAGRHPDPSIEPVPLRPGDLPGARNAEAPRTVEPMQATLTESPFSRPDWLFEPKLDGIRAIVTIVDGEVSMRSRRGNDITRQYPALVAALARQPVASAVFDGEIVAFDDAGRPSFEALQQRMNLQNDTEIRQSEAATPVVFYAFDLPYLDGFDLARVPLWVRKETLERVLLPSARIQYLGHIDDDGEAAYAGADKIGLEGVVAKRRDSTYEAGRRSRNWLKVKSRTSEEFVVGGFSAGNGGRAGTFGALVIGQYDADGGLVPSGRVGSGFDDRTLEALRARLEPLVRADSPFASPPEGPADITWVEPQMAVEVTFAEWTSDGNLRAPVFVRVRDDLDPATVTHAEVAPPPEVLSTPAVISRHTPPVEAGDAPASTALASEIASVLAQLEGRAKSMTLEVEGHQIKVTNLDKEMWPAWEEQRPLTKRDLLVYLAKAAPLLLPELRDRPLTMTRYPNGLEGGSFYQKHNEHAPDFVQTFLVFADSRDQEFMVCNNLATLLWSGQIANLALHTSLTRIDPRPDAVGRPTDFAGSREAVEASVLNYPDFVLFDLDPYIYAGFEGEGEEPELNRAAYQRTCEVALWLKELLDAAGLSAFVKTSGATGLHILVPVLRNLDFATVRSVSETFGRFLVAAHPKDVTMEWQTKNRTGKVFFDSNQNARIKNIAAAYSPRAKPGAPVSVPLRWSELTKVYPTDFTILTAPDRFEAAGDLWAHILEAKQDLAALVESFEG
ncbi:MAG: non-homologous end-joining DNA ligase [Dehalococcoidia bacterium]